METAALALLALGANLSGMGVLFGWQPMPDDSEKVEYIVQIEPELAATLRAGQSIPITSDIPDDIGPIGRIRIVVGRDELPRQKLATRMKPWPVQPDLQKKSREGLVETQFTVPPVESSGAGRYGQNGATSNSILPPDGKDAAANNPFAKSLQQSAQNARNLASDVKNQILPPSSDQLFGSGKSASPGLQNAINNTKNQVTQGFQRNVAQVADRGGQQLRQAVNDFGNSASNAVNDLGRSLTGDQSRSSNRQDNSGSTILPPDSNMAGRPSVSGQQSQSFQPRQQPPQRQLQRQPPQQRSPDSSFAGAPQAGSNPTSQQGDFSAPWPATGASQPTTTSVSTPPSTRYGSQQSPTWQNASQNQQQIQQPRQDSFDLANRQDSNPVPRNNYGQAGYNPPSNSLEGPQLTMPAQQQRQLPTSPPTTDVAVQNRSGPAITSDMLPNAQSNNMLTVGANQNQQRQFAARQPLDTRPQALGWDQNAQNQNQGGMDSYNTHGLGAIALMCVVLTSSVFGNFFLGWSYFDLRNKYRGIVHGAPIRRERYDD